MARATTVRTVQMAKALRREMTLPEILLWQILRRKPLGLKFRRQHPLGPYVLDFYCPAAKLAVEIDGSAHDMGDRPARDGRRDAVLAERGIEVLRIAASEVLADVERTAQSIVDRCRRE